MTLSKASQLMALAEKPLKAFAVTEEGEGTGGIIFARHGIVARREGADRYGDGDFHYVTCRRAKWADAFADTGEVTVAVMVENGWHFECGACGTRIDSDMLWERDLSPEDIIGTQNSTAYCNAVCEARQRLRRAEAKHLETRWVRRFKKIIRRRFPTVKIGDTDWSKPHAYAKIRQGKLSIDQVFVSFDFPGSQYGPASLRFSRNYDRKPYWSCASGDREAFEAFARAHALLDKEPQE